MLLLQTQQRQTRNSNQRPTLRGVVLVLLMTAGLWVRAQFAARRGAAAIGRVLMSL